MKKIALFLLISASLFAGCEYTPWYTGPLIASSGVTQTAKTLNIQPYIWVFNSYAIYKNDWGHRSIPSVLTTSFELLPGYGINEWSEIICDISENYFKRGAQHAWTFSDAMVGLGFHIVDGINYIPDIKLCIREIFPTGKYKHLDPNKNGIDAGGMGSYKTVFKLCMSKMSCYFPRHPIFWRFNVNYIISTNVKVKGFNSYGGGYGTDGTVRPGQVVGLDLAFELSFTQKTALIMEIIYNHIEASHFSGINGTDSTGSEAVNSTPSLESISMYPGLEYNFTPNMGLIGSFLFTVAGRNSIALWGGVISFEVTF